MLTNTKNWNTYTLPDTLLNLTKIKFAHFNKTNFTVTYEIDDWHILSCKSWSQTWLGFFTCCKMPIHKDGFRITHLSSFETACPNDGRTGLWLRSWLWPNLKIDDWKLKNHCKPVVGHFTICQAYITHKFHKTKSDFCSFGWSMAYPREDMVSIK